MKHFCFVVKLNIELNYNQKKVTNKILDQFSVVLLQYLKADTGKLLYFTIQNPRPIMKPRALTRSKDPKAIQQLNRSP